VKTKSNVNSLFVQMAIHLPVICVVEAVTKEHSVN